MIREMNREECLRVLARGRLARLACARENQPYVVPVYLAYHEASGCLYGFTTPGEKVAWMRTNPLVCVELDEVVSYDQWVSIIATGRYEEVPETPGSNGAHLQSEEHRRQIGEAVPAWFADNQHRQCEEERERVWQVLKALPEIGRKRRLQAW